MSTLVLRSGVNRALTSTEIDANFTALNTDKVETTAPVFSGLVTLPSQSIDLTESNLPDVAPSLNLDFANSKQLDSRITFGRGSGGAYYDGKTTAKAEENLFLNSNSIPSGYNITAITNTYAAPNGTTTASQLTVNSDTVRNLTYQYFNTAANVPYTVSCFVKAGTNRYCVLHSEGSGNYIQVFDIIAGGGGVVGESAVQSCILNSPSITYIGSDWYRISVTVTFPIAITSNIFGVGIVPLATGNTLGAFLLPLNNVIGNTIFAWGWQLEQRSSVTVYTPTTTAPITNYIPVLLQAPLNTPRFDHDSRPTFNGTCTVSGSAVTLPTTFADGSSPSTINKFYTGSITISGTVYVITNYVGSTRVVTVTGSPTAGAFSLANKNYGQSLGLLIEEARENKLTYSSDFSNGFWNKVNATITANTLVAPDGTLTGATITATTGNGYIARGSMGATSATLSIYVKQGVGTSFSLSTSGSSAADSAFFNLGTGTVVSTGANNVASSITSVGNGWYRLTVTRGSVASSNIYIGYLSSSAAPNDYHYIWGAQLETGSFATSYIPTPSNATVTRQPDIASMSGTNFSSWYNQAEGSFYIESDCNGYGVSSSNRLLYLQDSSANLVRQIFEFPTAIYATAVSNLIVSVNTYLKLSKIIYSFNPINSYLIGNGGSIVTNTYSPTNVPITMHIGRTNTGGECNGHIRKLTYYPKALSAPQLQGLTKL